MPIPNQRWKTRVPSVNARTRSARALVLRRRQYSALYTRTIDNAIRWAVTIHSLYFGVRAVLAALPGRPTHDRAVRAKCPPRGPLQRTCAHVPPLLDPFHTHNTPLFEPLLPHTTHGMGDSLPKHACSRANTDTDRVQRHARSQRDRQADRTQAHTLERTGQLRKRPSLTSLGECGLPARAADAK